MSSPIHRSRRWSGQRTRPSPLALRLWLVLVAAVLGLGSGMRPGIESPVPTAQSVVRAGTNGPASPGERPGEPGPLHGKGQAKEAKDGKKGKDPGDVDEPPRRRASGSMIAFASTVRLPGAAVAWHRFDAIEPAWSGVAHRAVHHGRGPPLR